MVQRIFSTPNAVVAQTWCDLAGIKMKAGKLNEAESLLRKSLGIFSADYVRGNRILATTELDLASCLTAQERYDEAEQLFLKASEDINASQSENSPVRQHAKQKIMELYSRSKKAPNPLLLDL